MTLNTHVEQHINKFHILLQLQNTDHMECFKKSGKQIIHNLRMVRYQAIKEKKQTGHRIQIVQYLMNCYISL